MSVSMIVSFPRHSSFMLLEGNKVIILRPSSLSDTLRKLGSEYILASWSGSQKLLLGSGRLFLHAYSSAAVQFLGLGGGGGVSLYKCQRVRPVTLVSYVKKM